MRAGWIRGSSDGGRGPRLENRRHDRNPGRPCRVRDRRRARLSARRSRFQRTARFPADAQIELSVAVLPATEKSVRRADPLFYITGGPGGVDLEQLPGIASAFVDINSHRDIVFVDQRGVGGSNPLQCKLATLNGAIADLVAACLGQVACRCDDVPHAGGDGRPRCGSADPRVRPDRPLRRLVRRDRRPGLSAAPSGDGARGRARRCHPARRPRLRTVGFQRAAGVGPARQALQVGRAVPADLPALVRPVPGSAGAPRQETGPSRAGHGRRSFDRRDDRRDAHLVGELSPGAVHDCPGGEGELHGALSRDRQLLVLERARSR